MSTQNKVITMTERAENAKACLDGGATKKESRSRAWLVDAQCRAVLRRDWTAERAYEARILALDEAAAKK